MEEIFNEIRNGLDVPYMLVVNVVTYLIIKGVDRLNGDKAVPKYLKVCTAIIVGILIGVGAWYLGAEARTIFYSFFISIVSWDVFKVIIKKYLPKIDYKK